MENNNQKAKNLEYEINNVAFEIVSENILDETEINKLLGVLANDGVYAMWVYALDKIKIKDNKDRMGLFINQLFNFSEIFEILNEESNTGEKIRSLKELNNDINKLLKKEEKLNDNEYEFRDLLSIKLNPVIGCQLVLALPCWFQITVLLK